MTDETPEKRTRRAQPTPSGGAPPADVAGGEDPDAALRRLETMGTAKPHTGAPPLPPAPAVDSFRPSRAGRRPLAAGSSRRPSRSLPRPAAGSDSRAIARIAAPIVFLVAVIALIAIVVQSGVMSADEPISTPTVKATKAAGSAKTTKKYVVKSGDSLSSIAARFNTTTSELTTLNPDLGNTLVVGTRIVVPNR